MLVVPQTNAARWPQCNSALILSAEFSPCCAPLRKPVLVGRRGDVFYASLCAENLKDRRGHLDQCEETSSHTSGPFNLASCVEEKIAGMWLEVTISTSEDSCEVAVLVICIQLQFSRSHVHQDDAKKSVGSFQYWLAFTQWWTAKDDVLDAFGTINRKKRVVLMRWAIYLPRRRSISQISWYCRPLTTQ